MFFFSRSGFTTSPSVSPLFWLGDQLPTWDERDGMASALSGTLAMYMDEHNRRPNATASVWRSEPSVGGASTLEVPADDPALQACSPYSLRRPTKPRRGQPDPEPAPHPIP